jgi:two-component system, cell cycle response regulator DivK
MRRRILIVEDTEDNLHIARDLLSSAGYDLLEATDGAAAVSMAALHQPDLILMDIQLPKLNGYDATRQIRANAALDSVPIIAITSYALSGDDIKAKAAGCDAYIAKPYSPRALLAEIRRFLGPSGQS